MYNKIVKQRLKDLKNRMNKKPIKKLKYELKDAKPPKDFKKFLKGKFSLICEYKRASPSKGQISRKSLEYCVKAFEKGGCDAISILTEERYFDGSIEYLRKASSLVDLPILRKDFIIDEYQIYEARVNGASSVLLIADLYPDLASGIELCRSLGMEPLVECKNSKEIERALDAGAEIIGINNRDLRTFEIDLERTKKLAPFVKDAILVSESGVSSPADVKKLYEYGADAVLVGTYVMSCKNIENCVKNLKNIVMEDSCGS
ncbi:Indole-3-glycerol-phosphate synthase [Methanothermus fervidus DSM 2088]|uniref:Indole-3-glycerol phosphate synthase n=1 Tax=Methanothermus fervidus (strain ATCC 43054 / DSM 2088 / JCM 10308 / V24 S) TaxID=523846 RepID=E3GX11_METFV|nr:indole-3-glycerol phosphate synthase TrpC [Methanothermus fervidus]ADP76900.1 Indole-3-glycerol-phosphate synthase [Methanothermus fervidus DSM 2088]